MKVSLRLSDDDVAFLDEYASARKLSSRSAVVKIAIKALRLGDLRDVYGDAWAEWEASGEASSWEATVGDGV